MGSTDARKAIAEAAAAVWGASLAATWEAPTPAQARAIAEATEYAMAAIRGIARALDPDRFPAESR